MDINDVTYTDNPDLARSGEAFWFDDNKGQGLVDEIWAERRGQIDGGCTHEYDDAHGAGAQIRLARILLGESSTREHLIEAIALLVAAIETMDRQTDA
jgi:hypothetical protein